MIELTLAEVASAVGSDVVLIKASRLFGLERVAEGLLGAGLIGPAGESST